MTSVLLAAALAASVLVPQSMPASEPRMVSRLVDESIEVGWNADFDVAALIGPSEREDRWAQIAIAAHVVAQFADVGTTLYSLGRLGCDDNGSARAGSSVCFYEANPLLRWSTRDPMLFAVVKGLAAVGITTVLLKQRKKHPRQVLVAAIISAAVTGYVAHRNAEQIRRHQK